MSEPTADYGDLLEGVPLELWSSLDYLLNGVGHQWTYDDSIHKVWCHDCHWGLREVDFLPAVEAARAHINQVKVAVLDRYKATLTPAPIGRRNDA